MLEDRTDEVAAFSATDADEDAIVWSLSGADAALFTIVGGVLEFKSSPDFEKPGDQGSDNTYNVTVQRLRRQHRRSRNGDERGRSGYGET